MVNYTGLIQAIKDHSEVITELDELHTTIGAISSCFEPPKTAITFLFPRCLSGGGLLIFAYTSDILKEKSSILKYMAVDKNKAKLARAKYLAKKEVKERERDRKRKWYEDKIQNDPEFAAKEKDRLSALSKTEERKAYQREYQRQYRAAKRAEDDKEALK